jgi:hypothetical protein
MNNVRDALARAAAPGMILAVAVVACFAILAVRDVYSGIPPAVPVSSMSAACTGDSPLVQCETSVVALNPGRFRIAASVPAARVTIQVGDRSAVSAVHFLLTRSAVPGRWVVGGEAVAGAVDVPEAGVRHVIAVPATAGEWDRVTFTPASSDRPTMIDELGFFAGEAGLLRSELQPLQAIPPRSYLRYVTVATLGLCVALVAAAWFLPDRRLKRLGPWLAAALCFSIAILELDTAFSPYWERDLRSFYASEWLPMGPDSNLTGPLYEGSRIVQGLGETVRPGVVQYHRMPGYGLFCAVAAVIGRTTDVIEIAARVVLLQVLLYAVATGVLVYAAQPMFGARIAWLLGILIAMLPKQLGYTQVDSVIVPIQLFVLAALLRYLAAERDGQATFGRFLWVSFAFALWFVMRNDVLPGWVVVSCVLVRGCWRRLAVPVALIAAIAVAWALYKLPYRHEFDLMPTNSGEVLLLSLCEVPGAFPFECTDAGYFEWARRAGHADPSTNLASMHAATEVVRHWATYPVHFAFMVSSKARRALTTESFPGFQTWFNRPYGLAGDTGVFIVLFTAMAAALAANHHRRRTFLLAWAVFLNMPMFFVAFASSGRFYPAAGASLVVAAVPLLCDAGFYKALARHPRRTAVVIACVAAFLAGGSRVDALIEANDTLHYWTPLVDPGRSTLKFIGR